LERRVVDCPFGVEEKCVTGDKLASFETASYNDDDENEWRK
jgi:hypothetical protein